MDNTSAQRTHGGRLHKSKPNTVLKNLEFVIPNGVREVRNLSFLGIPIEEGFLASLGTTVEPVSQQAVKD